MSVVLNTTVPSSVLKKKHNAIAYHRVREAIAAGIIRFYHIRSEDNLADVLTNPLPHCIFYRLIRPWLFCAPEHIEHERALSQDSQVPSQVEPEATNTVNTGSNAEGNLADVLTRPLPHGNIHIERKQESSQDPPTEPETTNRANMGNDANAPS